MPLVIVKSHASAADVPIADVGIVIPGAGGFESFITFDEVLTLQESKDLARLLTDNVFGAGASTLKLNNGTGDILQQYAQAFLDSVLVTTTGPYSFPVRDSSGAETVAVFTGDSGSGGIKGLVPAPATGDGAAQKFLKATGGWATPSGLPVGAKGDLLYHNGTSWVPFVPGASGKILVTKGPGADPAWESTTTAVKRSWSFPIEKTPNLFIEVNTLAWAAVVQFTWPGTTNVDALTKLSAILRYATNDANSGSCRIYDVTNGLVVATKTGVLYTTDFAIVDLGTISNLSTGPAIWELQLSVLSNGKQIQCGGFAGVW